MWIAMKKRTKPKRVRLTMYVPQFIYKRNRQQFKVQGISYPWDMELLAFEKNKYIKFGPRRIPHDRTTHYSRWKRLHVYKARS